MARLRRDWEKTMTGGLSRYEETKIYKLRKAASKSGRWAPASEVARAGGRSPRLKMEPRKVLVVEDEKNIRDLVCLHLGVEGYDCVPVGDGKEAMLLASEKTFDLIILDLMLPGMDGV